MFANERHELICKMLQEKSAVTVSELTKYFSVSVETIRRDLLALEQKNLLQRVHGGAISSVRMSAAHQYSTRLDENRALKYELSGYAADLIEEGDTIAIDSGTTAIELAEIIKTRFRKLTVVTHDPKVFQILSDNEGLELIMVGGSFAREEYAFCGPIAVSAYKMLHVNKAFIFPSVVSLKCGATGFTGELITIQKILLDIADEVIICADSDKFEKAALIKLCDLSPNHIYVTDSKLSDSIYELYAENNIRIVKGNKTK